MKLQELTANQFLDTNVSDLTAQKAFEREHITKDRMGVKSAQIFDGKLFIAFKTYPTDPRTPSNYITSLVYQPCQLTAADWKNFKEAERMQAIRDLLEQAEIQVDCTCPAFHFQGHHEQDYSQGSAAYSFFGPKGTGHWKGLHGNKNGACKHVYLALTKVASQYLPLLVKSIEFI